MRRAVSSSSKDSCSITWHQWQAEYPMERRIGRSSARASSKASSPHGYQSTGLSACWRRYGLVSPARRFISLLSPSFGAVASSGSAGTVGKATVPRVEGIGLAGGAGLQSLGGGGLGPAVVRLAGR